ncbi:MAG: DinB family protein, partial [Acidobacteriota bacterium]
MTEQELKAHIKALESNPKLIVNAVKDLSTQLTNFKPSPDKWSIREVVAHLADTEIVYGHRIRQM